MEIINDIIKTTLESFDLSYCISVNVLTYIIITIVTNIKKKDVGMWTKRVFLLGVILIVGLVYYFTGSNIRLLLNSAILAPVFWSWVLKPVCKAFDVDYKDININ